MRVSYVDMEQVRNLFPAGISIELSDGTRKVYFTGCGVLNHRTGTFLVVYKLEDRGDSPVEIKPYIGDHNEGERFM